MWGGWVRLLPGPVHPPSVRPQGFRPPGVPQSLRGVDALWQLDSSNHSLAGPPCVFRHSGGLMPPPPRSPNPGDLWATLEALRPPSMPRTPEVFLACFPRLPLDLPLCAGLAPWQPCAPALSAAAEGYFPVSPPPSIASPCICSAPLSWVHHDVAFRVSLSPPGSPAVVVSSSVDDPSVSSKSAPPHSALYSSLPSWSAPLARYSTPSPSLLTCSLCLSWPATN